MKRRQRPLPLLFFAALLALLAACGSQQPTVILDTASNVYVCSKDPFSCTFNVSLFSNRRIRQVDYIALQSNDGSTEGCSVNIGDSNNEDLDRFRHQGYYFQDLSVKITCDEPGKRICVDALVLNVDGTPYTLTFPTPVTHTFADGMSFSEELQIGVIPFDFPSSFINNDSESFQYIFTAQEDVVLQDVHFDAFLSPANMMYAIGGGAFRKAEFPISLKQGQTLNLSLSFQSDQASPFSSVATTLHFDYLVASSQQPRTNSCAVFFNPISPIPDHDTSHISRMLDDLLARE